MSFHFGGPNFRSYDMLDLLQAVQILGGAVWFIYRHRNQIRWFLKRNGGVITGIMAILMAGILAGPFAYGSIVTALGIIEVHELIQIVYFIAAAGFGIFTVLAVRATLREWRRRPEPMPVGTD